MNKKEKKRSAVTGFVSVSAFASLLGILIGITSSAATIKNCVTTARIKKCTSIIKKKKKKHDKIVLLEKSMLNAFKILISKAGRYNLVVEPKKTAQQNFFYTKELQTK